MRSIALAAAVLLCACGPSLQSGAPASGVTLEVEPDAAAAGDSVTLVLRNGTAEPVGYNLCTSALERRAGGGWQAVPSDRICTMELRTLAPGEVARYPMDLAAGLAPGEYRFLTNVEMMDTRSRSGVRSEPFTVRP